jgi:hypothetical protein
VPASRLRDGAAASAALTDMAWTPEDLVALLLNGTLASSAALLPLDGKRSASSASLSSPSNVAGSSVLTTFVGAAEPLVLLAELWAVDAVGGGDGGAPALRARGVPVVDGAASSTAAGGAGAAASAALGLEGAYAALNAARGGWLLPWSGNAARSASPPASVSADADGVS